MKEREMYKYCPMCGNGLVYAVPERDDRKRHLCKQCGYIIYRNPKPTSSGFIVEDGKILLTKRAFEPFPGDLVSLMKVLKKHWYANFRRN